MQISNWTASNSFAQQILYKNSAFTLLTCLSSAILPYIVFLLIILTSFRSAIEWINPAQYNLVVVTSSEGRNLPYGKLEDILNRDSAALNCHTNDDK